MKFSATVFVASLATSAAFVAPSTKSVKMNLRMVEDEPNEPIEPAQVPESQSPFASTREPGLSAMSQSLPFMERPPALDGSLAGDVGFDPLGFAKTSAELMNYREAEIKHARLAMLAAAGWPLSELWDSKIAGLLNVAPALQSDDRAPSILNGGLGKISPIYWLACLAGAAAIDVYGITKASKKPGYTPGDFGFDPLGLYPKDKEGQEWFKLAEIKNGRLAMIAITAFAVQELVTHTGVINETPLFFKPLGETFHEATNAGYIQ